ncbi:GNAT family N-acetyltransferase [Vibrio vulnificus]|uniref:GNAT family N-acetyltransferase n=2 Tax=Vibrio TaxID=662 RepID=UPI0005F178EA|nr:GNAT family N-acetyltransferase [Vibrio vulnificus]EHZ2552405.1 GNAT family N-acetyltransferase [Vibrio vulnificus]HDY7694856.1 GNAT family N-acetyltransferase [Vibrio vulnificus]HDY7809384.1 GNAT family N-acetyltransferase [Vibrio vulnificus]
MSKLSFHKTSDENELKTIQNELSMEINTRWPGIRDIYGGSTYIVAIVDSKAQGVVTIRDGEEFSEIYKLYVAPKARRSGIGKKLFYLALEHISQQGIMEVGIQAVGDSANFWNRTLPQKGVEIVGDRAIIQLSEG